MKPSHEKTPRQQSETTFWYGGEAIEVPERKQVSLWRWAAVIGWSLLFLSLIGGVK
jgi:hypothetical protein